MKQLSRQVIAGRLVAAALVLATGWGLAVLPAKAQQKPAAPSAAAIGYAKEILTMKNVGAMYANAVPSVVQHTKDILLQSNLNYQKDLNEAAVVVAQKMAGREKEIGEEWAKIYATDFTEQELKDLVAFYKSPLGQKLLVQEPKTISASINFMNQWGQLFSGQVNGAFVEEMKKRGKPIGN
jgi:hypothetical protein